MEDISLINSHGRTYRVRKSTLLSSSLNDKYSKYHTNESSQTVENRVKTPFKKVLLVPNQLYGFIIGKGGSTIQEIQTSTRTRLIIPRPNDPFIKDAITIEGAEESNIKEAESMVKQIVEKFMFKIPYTHFISIPINDDRVGRKVQDLQTRILSEFSNGGSIRKEWMIPVAKLHLTLGVLRLLNQEQIEKAIKLLKSLKSEIYDMLGAHPLLSELQELKTMQDNPEKALHVLYIGVKDIKDSLSSSIEKVCNFCQRQVYRRRVGQ